MYRVIDKRSSGKTSRLLLLAKENKGTVVCSNPRAMMEKAHAYGITGIDFISYSEFFRLPGADIGNYYIDELENFIQAAQLRCGLHGHLDGYTISEED